MLIFFIVFKINLSIEKKIILPEPISRQTFMEQLVENNIITANTTTIDDIITSHISKNEISNKNTIISQVITESINLDVPFVVQAPFANREMPYKEACEEASLLMAIGYLHGKKYFYPEEMKNQIDDLVSWQQEFFGEHKNLNITETAKVAQNYFQVDYKIIENLNIEDIKMELNNGYPVIIPANGRLLENPNFRGEGPLYHMLIIKGYKDDYFITNDPGTRNGKDYLYSFAKLMNAIADWTGNVSDANKVGLIIYN